MLENGHNLLSELELAIRNGLVRETTLCGYSVSASGSQPLRFLTLRSGITRVELSYLDWTRLIICTILPVRFLKPDPFLLILPSLFSDTLSIEAYIRESSHISQCFYAAAFQ